MNILFVSAVLPYPLHSGGQVRIYNLLRSLSRRHSIHLLSFIRNQNESRNLRELEFCQRITTVLRGPAWQARYIVRSLMTPDSFLFSTYHHDSVRRIIETELQTLRYDLIHIEPGYVASSVPKTRVPIIVSEHNVEHEVYEKYVSHFKIPWLRPVLRLDVGKMKTNETDIWKRAGAITAVSEYDAEYISHQTAGSDVTVVPNGVDTGYFSFKPRDSVRRAPVCLYVGTFAWIQNVDAVTHLLTNIWPEISASFPGATLRIVGDNPPKRLRQAAGTGVTFLGSVPDIRNEYYASDMLLAPIRVGGGTKYKIIESMACGLPVITTRDGTLGFRFTNGKELWIADTPGDVVRAVDDIIRSTVRKKILRTARDHAEREYSWETISGLLEGVWKKTNETKKH